MVMILACLSAMLTLGGGAMALYGADMIRSESGLALTGSGVTMTSAGLVLLGITCLFAEMRRMRRLMEAEEILPPVTVAVQHQPPVASPAHAAPAPAPATPAHATPAHAMPSPPAPPVAAPPAAEAAKPLQKASEAPHAASTAATPSPAVSSAAKPASPPPVMPPPLDVPERSRPAGSGIPAEAMASLVGSAAMLKGARGAGRGEASMDTPAAGLAPVGKPVEVPARGEPVLTASAEGAPSGPPAGTQGATADTAFDLPPDAGPRTMLATYNSGGITYFMYSDSSIEADMTGGRYRFASMDELRTFIETGKGGTLVTPAETPAATEAEKV